MTKAEREGTMNSSGCSLLSAHWFSQESFSGQETTRTKISCSLSVCFAVEESILHKRCQYIKGRQSF